MRYAPVKTVPYKASRQVIELVTNKGELEWNKINKQ